MENLCYEEFWIDSCLNRKKYCEAVNYFHPEGPSGYTYIEEGVSDKMAFRRGASIVWIDGFTEMGGNNPALLLIGNKKGNLFVYCIYKKV